MAVLAVVSTALAATAAQAEPYYFHQPGVTREIYAEDVTVCRELAGMGVTKRADTPYSNNIYATMASAFLNGFLNSSERRRHEQAIERICMADKGYARIAIDKNELKRIRELGSDEARMDALFELAATAEPKGKELSE